MSSIEAQEAIRTMVVQTPRDEAIRHFGKEVPGYVLHFAGGVVDAITGGGGGGGGQKETKDKPKDHLQAITDQATKHTTKKP
jgi:hypothetical protein